MLVTLFILAFARGDGTVAKNESARGSSSAERCRNFARGAERGSASIARFCSQLERPFVSKADGNDATFDPAQWRRELAERRVVLILIFEAGTFTVDGVAPLLRVLTAEESASARERFGVKLSGFKVVLIGTDGTAKRLWQKPVALDTIVGLIETMPGRKREKAERERSGLH